MSLVTASKIQSISQAKDPKQAIIDAAGDLSKESVLWDLVLIGTYIRPEKTLGGIIRPKENVEEDAYQSKTGVVLKFGEEIVDPIYNVGDWVVYSIKDGWAITVNGTPCRLVPYDRVRMKLSDPSVVF
jgi:co-chaperonin GroES (HSP10)